jgi:hypothetical protein
MNNVVVLSMFFIVKLSVVMQNVVVLSVVAPTDAFFLIVFTFPYVLEISI